MAGKVITLKLNQQQLELLDRTIAGGAAPDRAALVRRALREYAMRHGRVPPPVFGVPFDAPAGGKVGK